MNETDVFCLFVCLFSYRCQALLYYKLFKMKKHEAKDYQKVLSEYFNNKVSATETEI